MRFLTHLLVFSIVFYGFHVSSIGAAPRPIPTSLPSFTEGSNDDGSNFGGFVERGSKSDGISNNIPAGGRKDSGLVNEGAKFIENAGPAVATGLGKGASSIVKGSADTALGLTEVVATPITSNLRNLLSLLSAPLQAMEVMIEPSIAIVKTISRTPMGTWSEYDKLNGNVNGDENKDTKSRSKRSVVSDVESSLEALVTAPFDLAQRTYNIIEAEVNDGIWEAVRLMATVFWNFFLEFLLPSVHDLLDESMSLNLLPEQLKPFVKTFDTVYNVFQFLGYIK